jgi:hypothetical protein
MNIFAMALTDIINSWMLLGIPRIVDNQIVDIPFGLEFHNFDILKVDRLDIEGWGLKR